jgi:hypothetical protein
VEVGFRASLHSAIKETLAGRKSCRVESVVFEANESREEDERVARREPIEAPALVFPAISCVREIEIKINQKIFMTAERNLQ